MRGLGGLAALALLGACADGHAPRSAGGTPAGDGAVKVGPPYTVNGVRYVPADDAYYDALGLASSYGRESGATTASGEALRREAYSAAHATLPLPSYAEVTALASGRTIMVRINDRGPFARGRLIDLSEAAARALGIDGSAPVRVRRVYPPEDERVALREGRPGSPRMAASSQLLASLRARWTAGGGGVVRLAAGPMPDPRGMAVGEPARPGFTSDAALAYSPVSEPAPPTPPDREPRRAAPAVPAAVAAHGWSVQLGAFGDRARAVGLARDAGGHVVTAGSLTRVRVGPFASEAAARDALAKLRARGYAGAAIVRE